MSELDRPELWCLEEDDATRAAVTRSLEGRFRLHFINDLATLVDWISNDRARPAALLTELKLREGDIRQVFRERHLLERLASPVVVLSSAEDVEDLRFCFANGVADYLVKPAHHVELLAKVERVVHARAGRAGVHLDPMRLTATRQGITSPVLTPKEYQLVTALLSGGAHPIAPKALRQMLWHAKAVSDKALDVHLSHLRKKLLPLGLRIHRERLGLTVAVIEPRANN